MPKIKIGEAKLFFDVYGSKLKIGADNVVEKPTLLILHGGHGVVDHTLYVEFWSQFSELAQVIFLDQRGCGRSDYRDASEWNLRQWGQDIYDVCEALAIRKPIVAGVSMGGHVICEYVTQHPEHPGALIFCNTEAKMDIDAMVDKFRELGGEKIARICRENYLAPTPEAVVTYRDQCIPYYATNPYTSTEIKRCIQRMEIFEHYCKKEMTHFDYLNELYKIQCPVLFMVGEKSPGHPPKLAETMAKKIDKRWVHYHEFKEAGAPVYNDAPKESEKVVKDFIKIVTIK